MQLRILNLCENVTNKKKKKENSNFCELLCPQTTWTIAMVPADLTGVQLQVFLACPPWNLNSDNISSQQFLHMILNLIEYLPDDWSHLFKTFFLPMLIINFSKKLVVCLKVFFWKKITQQYSVFIYLNKYWLGTDSVTKPMLEDEYKIMKKTDSFFARRLKNFK